MFLSKCNIGNKALNKMANYDNKYLGHLTKWVDLVNVCFGNSVVAIIFNIFINLILFSLRCLFLVMSGGYCI